ncbi:hypothetical protein IKG64_01345 [Candidatus Saccharibacteria bacterium]|nr:hypothetical protein [Candidatus Saccharibacteria bacterium]
MDQNPQGDNNPVKSQTEAKPEPVTSQSEVSAQPVAEQPEPGQSETSTRPSTQSSAMEQSTVTQPESTTMADSASVVEPTKKKSKTVPVLVTIIILLIVGVGTTTAIAFLPKGSDGELAQDNQAIPEEAELLSKLKLEGNDLSNFDLEFLKMEEEENNKIYSPLSIKYALAMLADGADGESKTQITNIIGDYKPKAYLNSANRSLANAMFVRDGFADVIKETYVSDIKAKYNADVIYDSFNTPENANKWVSDQTLGIINNMFDENTLNPNISFMLVNALAIDMGWKNQLQCTAQSEAERPVPCKHWGVYNVRYSHESPDANQYIGLIADDNSFEKITFNGAEGASSARIGANANRYDIISELGEEYIRDTVQAEYQKWLAENDSTEEENEFDIEEYMSQLAANYGKLDQSTDFYFYDSDSEKVFAKNLQTYDGATLQYVGIMPKSKNLNDYIKNLTAEEIKSLVSNLKDAESLSSYTDGVVTKLYANIPFFKYDFEIADMIDDLAELGITNVFSEKDADLSNMVNTENFDGDACISGAVHKADIDFSNNGIKAAAVTGIFGAGSTGGGFDYEWDIPIEEIDMTFDQPFMYLIRDKDSGEAWFVGAVYNLAN